jgi:hypothetical protein
MREVYALKRKNGGRNNAFRHGAFAQDLVLPGEYPKEFEDLHRGLIEEWKPDGPVEEDAVLSLAKCIMSKRRIDTFYRNEAQFAGDHPLELALIDVDRMWSTLKTVKTFGHATEIIGRLPWQMRDELEKHVPRTRFGTNAVAWIEKLVSHLERLIDGLETAHYLDEKGSKFQAERATKLRELTEKKIALDDRVDALIDKTFKRLVQLKTYKEIVKQKELEAAGVNHNQNVNTQSKVAILQNERKARNSRPQ